MIRLAPVLTIAFASICAVPAVAGPPCPALLKASLAPKSYHTDIVRHANGRSTTSTIDLQRPDRAHTVLASGHEMLIVGNRTWMRKTGSAWQLLPGLDFGSTLKDMDPTAIVSDMKGISCDDAGMGVWHLQPAHVYKMEYTMGSQGAIHSTVYVLGDGFVHHIDATSAKGTTTIDYSRFNEVSVGPP